MLFRSPSGIIGIVTFGYPYEHHEPRAYTAAELCAYGDRCSAHSLDNESHDLNGLEGWKKQKVRRVCHRGYDTASSLHDVKLDSEIFLKSLDFSLGRFGACVIVLDIGHRHAYLHVELDFGFCA